MKDLNINFFIIPNPKEDYKEIIDYELFLENDKNVVFPSLDVNYIEILLNVKIKNDINKENNDDIKIKKIIGANIVDTRINYYFCLEILIH